MSGGPGDAANGIDLDVDRLVASVCEAGGVALGRWMVSVGEPGAWVPEAADVTELRLAASLRAMVPTARYVGSATAVVDEADGPVWVVDALGGREDFAAGLPGWCVSAALVTWLGVIAGAVYVPTLGDVYLYLDGSATWRTRPASVRAGEGFGDSPLVLVPDTWHEQLTIAIPCRVRCLGPPALHMLYVARGSALAGIAFDASIRDLAVALPFLRAAGGEACYLSGACVSLSELLDGRPVPEPVVFAPSRLLEPFRIAFARTGA